MPLGQICLAVHISQLAKLFCAFLISVVHSDHSHGAILCSSTHPVSSVSLLSTQSKYKANYRNCELAGGKNKKHLGGGEGFLRLNCQTVPDLL